MLKHELKGFITIDSTKVKGGKIISKLFDNKHFVLLKYVRGACQMDVKVCFDRVNYKHRVGETWFYNVDDDIYSISFHVLPWSDYKRVLFSDGIEPAFRARCLKDRYGSMPMRKKTSLVMKCGSSKRSDRNLKDSVISIMGD